MSDRSIETRLDKIEETLLKLTSELTEINVSGKHYQKLGKTKLTRVPEKTADWVRILVRELDKKENPDRIMDLLLFVAQNSK